MEKLNKSMRQQEIRSKPGLTQSHLLILTVSIKTDGRFTKTGQTKYSLGPLGN